MKRSNVNSPHKPGLMRDDKVQRRLIEEEKDQKVEDLAAEPLLLDADENFRTPLKSMCIQELAFLYKMEEELSNPEDYQELLKCLHIYSREIITREELKILVGQLLGESVDLMKEFNDFMSFCENHQKGIEETCENHPIFAE